MQWKARYSEAGLRGAPVLPWLEAAQGMFVPVERTNENFCNLH
jgi:hypothetical protein